MKFLLIICAVCFCFSLSRAQTFDASTECIGEASARADITYCLANLDSTNCITGQEDTCFTDNGYGTGTGLNERCTLKFDGNGPTPDGYIECVIPEGGTGFYDQFSLPALQDEINIRYYVKYGLSWGEYLSNVPHGMQINTTKDAGGCGAGGTIEQSARGRNFTENPWITYFTGGCSDDGATLLDDFTFQTGRWYLVNIRAKKDTSCTDNTSVIGCNGTWEVYIDGVLEYSRSDLNWVAGDTTASGFGTIQWPRRYWHGRGTAWPQTISFAGFVIGDDADIAIEADPTETLGTATGTPHYYHNGIEPFVTSVTDASTNSTDADTSLNNGNNKSKHVDGDCTGAGGRYMRGGTGRTQGTGFTVSYDSTINNIQTINGSVKDWETINNCSASYTPSDNSLKFTATSSTGVVFIQYSWLVSPYGPGSGPGTWPYPLLDDALCTGGSIYFPSGVNFAGGANFAGFFSTEASPNPDTDRDAERVALSVNSSNEWAVVFRDPDYLSGAQAEIGSGGSVSTETWYEYELCIYTDESASLTIDGTEIVAKTAFPNSLDYVGLDAAIGLSNYTETGTFTVHYDNVYTSSASRVDCSIGWDAGDCPTDYLIGAAPSTPVSLATGGNAILQALGIIN